MLAELPSAVIAEVERAAELLAKNDDAKLIEINSYPIPNTLVDITLAAKAGVILPELVKRMGIL